MVIASKKSRQQPQRTTTQARQRQWAMQGVHRETDMKRARYMDSSTLFIMSLQHVRRLALKLVRDAVPECDMHFVL